MRGTLPLLFNDTFTFIGHSTVEGSQNAQSLACGARDPMKRITVSLASGRAARIPRSTPSPLPGAGEGEKCRIHYRELRK